MPCCGGQPLAYLRREVPDGRDVGLRAQDAYEVAEAGTLSALAPDAVEFIADTDTLLTMCACSASSDQPY